MISKGNPTTKRHLLKSLRLLKPVRQRKEIPGGRS